MKSFDPIELLKNMLPIASLSRDEGAKADYLANFMSELGIKVNRHYNNIWTTSPDWNDSKPNILLNAHIDTVKPNASWTYEPHAATVADGRIYGLGANDDHASLVSLLAVYLKLISKPQPYNLVLAFSAEEEVSGKNGMESLVGVMPRIDFAVVGEPTGMQLAVAEKGLMVLDCVAKGVSGHAARNEGVNAIYNALADIAWFRDYTFPKISDTLGAVKTSVTVIGAGTQHNVVPDECKFVVDVRLNEFYTHQEALDIIKSNVKCSVTPRSMRLCPSGIAMDHPFVRRYTSMGGQVFGSSTLSDQALMPFASVKIGPGDSARSHTANEYIIPSEIDNAISTYFALLNDLEL